MAVSSSSAGVLVNAKGREIANYAAMPFVTIALVAAILPGGAGLTAGCCDATAFFRKAYFIGANRLKFQ